jgi:hypothetical protein
MVKNLPFQSFLNAKRDRRFWYFAARNNPSTAPLSLWFNGGVSTHLHSPSLYLPTDFPSAAWQLEHDRSFPRTWPLPNHQRFVIGHPQPLVLEQELESTFHRSASRSRLLARRPARWNIPTSCRRCVEIPANILSRLQVLLFGVARLGYLDGIVGHLQLQRTGV